MVGFQIINAFLTWADRTRGQTWLWHTCQLLGPMSQEAIKHLLWNELTYSKHDILKYMESL